jgi:hypothetical protein
VIAEAGNLLARGFAGLKDGRALWDFDLDPVDGEFRHTKLGSGASL